MSPARDASVSPPARRGRPPGSGQGAKRAPLDGRRTRDQEVLETAIRLFSQQGYAATSVQDLADDLGMLKGSLYYYIDTKETLLRRIFEDSHAACSEIAERYRAQDGPPLARLQDFLEEYALWYVSNRDRASLFAREWKHASSDLKTVMAKQRKYYDTVLSEFVKAAQQSGDVSADLDVKLATYYVLSAVSSLPDWFNPRGNRSARSVAAEYARMSVALLTSS